MNSFLVTLVFFDALDGCAEVAEGKLGVLTRDAKAGVFGTNSAIFTLPKGMVVRDASATGLGRFEPHRFKIIVTSEDPVLVDYAGPVIQERSGDAELYSADVTASPAWRE